MCVYAQQTYMHVNLKGGTSSSFPLQDMKITIRFDPCEVGDEQVQRNVISTFRLFQNYPNPFNPSTTIEYNIPKPGDVNIKVYDIAGRLVRTLISEHQELGSHRAKWDSKNDGGQRVASGMYLYQIRFDNVVISKKMLLLK